LRTTGVTAKVGHPQAQSFAARHPAGSEEVSPVTAFHAAIQSAASARSASEGSRHGCSLMFRVYEGGSRALMPLVTLSFLAHNADPREDLLPKAPQRVQGMVGAENFRLFAVGAKEVVANA